MNDSSLLSRLDTAHWHILDKSIGHAYIMPATPHLNGQVIDDVNLFNDRLGQWEDYYNYDQLYGTLAGQTPYDRLLSKARYPLS